MTLKKNKISIIIPCFNEEGNIEILHERICDVFKSLKEYNYEIIFVDDGSKDKTWSLIGDLYKKDDCIVGISLSRNHGHQLALTAGLSKSEGDYILILDADLQDPPELLPEMLSLLKKENADVVYGRRLKREGETWFKKSSATFFYILMNQLSHVSIPINTGDFRLFTKRVLLSFNSMEERYRFVRGMISWIGFKQVPFDYERKKRNSGKTKYSFKRMFYFALDAIAGFSIRPLKIASFLGFLFSFFAFFMIIFSFRTWWLGKTIQGWTSAIIVTLLLGGIQLMVLGVIGEYLGRMYMESKKRPLFLVDKIIKKEK